MSFVPGLGIIKGMALTLLRFFQPKATVKYPEETADTSPRFRGRLQLLYDEYGTLKCETCFQCAQACPIECIDMGGVDTRGRYAVHWGAAEQYAERREESALRRSGRPVPDQAYTHVAEVDLDPVRAILEDHDHDPHRMLQILDATQAAYGHLPVAALKEISFRTGAWYAMVYGTASYYGHLRFEQRLRAVGICRCTACILAGGGRVLAALERELGVGLARGTTANGLRLEQLSRHADGAPSPLVALDGVPQPEVTERTASTWGAALAGTRYH